jgi:hypothetical protein
MATQLEITYQLALAEDCLSIEAREHWEAELAKVSSAIHLYDVEVDEALASELQVALEQSDEPPLTVSQGWMSKFFDRLIGWSL